jgi:putative ABC transport system ATP-binding protein
MANKTVLEAKGVTKTYNNGTLQILKDINFSVQSGEFVCIMGASGSGKSTLLHLLGALDGMDSGEVLIEGKKITDMTDDEISAFRRRRLGFVFQFFNLLPTLTALENIALPALLDGKPLAEVEGRANELLRLMDLESRGDHRPQQLSGGQMQRVAIARALLASPALLLADEPTGNLDSKTGESVLMLLKKLNKEFNQTIVMVTHDPKAAMYATRLIEMKDGRIEKDSKV